MILTLIGTGVALGIVHVLTGPDHLSALATLSANVDSRTAFFLGIRWGIGHSTGLLTVGIVFILLSLSSSTETINIPDGISHFFESIVGIFMILLGLYGIRRAHHRKSNHLLDHDGLIRVLEDDNDSIVPTHRQQRSVEANEEDDEEKENYETFVETEDYIHAYHTHAHQSSFSIVDDLQNTESRQMEMHCWQVYTSKISTGMMALVAGIIHGLAGPGGVLGVIPAVQMHDAKLAAVYLGCFCLSSTLTMGLFAVLYGTSTMQLGRSLNSEFLVELISASFSIFVGVTWIVLLSIGKLDDIFP